MAKRTKTAGTTGTKTVNLPVSLKKPAKKRQTAKQRAAAKGRETQKTLIEKFLAPLRPLFERLDAAETEILIGNTILLQFEEYSPKTVLTKARNEKTVLAELTEVQQKFLEEVCEAMCEEFGKKPANVQFYLDAANLRHNFGPIIVRISGKCLRALGRLQKGNNSRCKQLIKLPINVERSKITKLLSEVAAGKHGRDYAGVAKAVDKLIGSKSTRGRKADKGTVKKETKEVKFTTVKLPASLRLVVETLEGFYTDKSVDETLWRNIACTLESQCTPIHRNIRIRVENSQ